MRNKYPGICYRCGNNVAPNEGHFQRRGNNINVKIIGRWLVQHADCAIEHRGTPYCYLDKQEVQGVL